MLEEYKTQFLPGGDLDVREAMQAFFQQWIENDQLAQVWHQHKTDATLAIATFLQEQTVILATINISDKQDWLEESINQLEALEKLQLRQRFLMGSVTWDSDNKTQIIQIVDTTLPLQKKIIRPELSDRTTIEAMIFMPEVGKGKQSNADITDLLRKGFTYARAFLNIINLSARLVTDEIQHALEAHLQTFKHQINKAHLIPNNKGIKSARMAYRLLLHTLKEMLVKMGIYSKEMDAAKGIIHMADFLWSSYCERPSIHIQESSKNHANMIVFEPKSVKGSGNKEALWIKKLAKKHPWVNSLPWQVLQRPRSLLNRDGEGLNIEKATLICVKKTKASASIEKDIYAMDCTPIGELGGIPVPFILRDLTERYRITLANQKGTYLGSRWHDDKPPFTQLEDIIFTQVDMLSPIITPFRRQKGITIPLVDLHVTRNAFLYKEAGMSWLQDRADANMEVRSILSRYAIYYHQTKKHFVYLDKTQTNFIAAEKKWMAAEDYMPIHIAFYDPTMIDSHFNLFACKTRQDSDALKAGLRIATERLEMLKEMLSALDGKMYQQDIHDIGTVQIFLQSRSLGFYSPQTIPREVIAATRHLSEKLRLPACPLKNSPNTSRKMKVEMLKILQSSLIVKSASFESIWTFLYRVMDIDLIGRLCVKPANHCIKKLLMAEANFSELLWSLGCILISPFFVAGWSLRFLMALTASIFKTPRGFFYLSQKMLGKSSNKSQQLIAAVSILFSAIGKKKLNCTNKTDHALSVLLMSGSMIHRAICSELIGGKTPLMSDDRPCKIDRMLAGKAMTYQQSLKATGL